MKLRHIFGVLFFTLFAASAFAQGAAGKWNATIEGPQGAFSMLFEFAVDGNNLTGSLSNDFMGTTAISDGTINGDDLSFKLSFETPNGAMTINYKARVNGDEMAITSSFENPPPGGGPPETTFTAKRVP
jgi:hypothetical protein